MNRPFANGWRETVALAAIVQLSLLSPLPARAETATTAQAVADLGTFEPYAPAVAQRAGLCLVDTGVNLNPDTESNVVARTAIDGGTGNDVSPTLHGTELAMMASAPTNGWGTVGTAPQAIQIVSVRILEPGQTTFPFDAYAAGITECLKLRHEYNIRVINLSLGSSGTPSPESYEAVADAIERTTNYGVAVVAAAGNDDGGALEYPAAYPSVLSVGATDTQSGAFCAFSNRGAGLRLLAPGCDLYGANPASGEARYNYWQGTSEASTITAAALDSLYAYQPSLQMQTGEQDLVEADNGVLDIAQTFRNVGLETVVSAGEAARPSTQAQLISGSPPQPVASLPTMPISSPFARPRALLRRVKRRLVLELTGRPREAETQVRYLDRQRRSSRLHLLRTLQGTFKSLVLPASGVTEVTARYIDPYDISRASPWTTLHLPVIASTTRKAHRRK